MKKLFLTIFVFLLLTSYAFAEKLCNNGTLIKGQNDNTYCISNISMNWFSAFSWCQAQNRKLASIHELCDIDEQHKWEGGFDSKACKNLINSHIPSSLWQAWFSIKDEIDPQLAYKFAFSDLRIYQHFLTSEYSALCY